LEQLKVLLSPALEAAPQGGAADAKVLRGKIALSAEAGQYRRR
jgi:hypothetical protein